MVHAVALVSGPVAAVKVTAAPTAPLFETAAAKVVQPHVPPEVVGAVPPARVKYGRCTVTESPIASVCDNVNVARIEVAAPCVRVAVSEPIVRLAPVNVR